MGMNTSPWPGSLILDNTINLPVLINLTSAVTPYTQCGTSLPLLINTIFLSETDPPTQGCSTSMLAAVPSGSETLTKGRYGD
jgi:hypothetical protein